MPLLSSILKYCMYKEGYIEKIVDRIWLVEGWLECCRNMFSDKHCKSYTEK